MAKLCLSAPFRRVTCRLANRPSLRSMSIESVDVAVIGAGTAGLSVAGLLVTQGGPKVQCVVLDDNPFPGASWQHRWESLKLFSTRKWSSLPLYAMPGDPDDYPSTREMASYLAAYEAKLGLKVERPVNVATVERIPDCGELLITSDHDQKWKAKAVVACSGGNHSPMHPAVPGSEDFQGIQLHSAAYRNPALFAGKRVAVVGEGNSGAQILSEVSKSAAEVLWITSKEPEYLPRTMSGKQVFDVSAAVVMETMRKRAELDKQQLQAILSQIPSLTKIIYVDAVREAEDRGGVLSSHRRPFSRFTPRGLAWDDNSTWDADAVIWCTGYGFDTEMLRPLGLLDERGRVDVKGTRSKAEPRLWLSGYGHWTGVASGSIPGAAFAAQATAAQVLACVAGSARK